MTTIVVPMPTMLHPHRATVSTAIVAKITGTAKVLWLFLPRLICLLCCRHRQASMDAQGRAGLTEKNRRGMELANQTRRRADELAMR